MSEQPFTLTPEQQAFLEETSHKLGAAHRAGIKRVKELREKYPDTIGEHIMVGEHWEGVGVSWSRENDPTERH